MSLAMKIGLAIACIIVALLPPFAILIAKRQFKKAEAKRAAEETKAETAFHSILPAEAKEKLEENKDIVLIDVRTREEYDQERIAGSILIPVDVIADEAPGRLPDKKTEIIVYCRSGARSQRAAKQLAALGYTNVYDMGGIQSWPYETVR